MILTRFVSFYLLRSACLRCQQHIVSLICVVPHAGHYFNVTFLSVLHHVCTPTMTFGSTAFALRSTKYIYELYDQPAFLNGDVYFMVQPVKHRTTCHIYVFCVAVYCFPTGEIYSIRLWCGSVWANRFAEHFWTSNVLSEREKCARNVTSLVSFR